MGFKRNKKNKQNRSEKSEKPKKEGPDSAYRLEKFNKVNEQFFNYYRLQEIVPEDEWDKFIETLREDLPSSFRVQNCLPEKDHMVKYLDEKYLEPLRNSDDAEVHAPEPIFFVEHAYQTNMSRQTVRSHPIAKDLHEFLINETSIGNISRQEAVSMVPPLLLDIQPHHLVLDACASPGSKTMQIIELIHKNSINPEGLIVANDIDYNRCYLLVHQTLKRMPTANCVVVNSDASQFPSVIGADEKPVFFDRVLCDVICSGDGTFRKNPDLWRTWDTQKALNLHKIQHSIASRCFELLAVGGLMAYSTCSLNPIEDEAIVAQMLRKYGDAIELVDVSQELPGLKRVPGRSSWKVLDKHSKEWSSHNELPANWKSVFVPSMFPPTEEESKKFNLQYSFRILPHHQNSGGFFVALLRKKTEVPGFDPTVAPKNRPMRRKLRTFREDPFVFLPKDGNLDDLAADLEKHYGVDRTKFPFENILIRTHNTEKKKCIYYVNDKLRDFLRMNGERYKVVNAGVGILRRVDKVSASQYRLMQDGLDALLPYLKKRIIDVDEEDLTLILNGWEDNHFVPLEHLKCKETLSQIECGSIVVHLKKDNFEANVCGWLGAHTVSAFISREEKIHILSMLDRDASKLKLKVMTVRKEKGLRKLDNEGGAIEENGNALELDQSGPKIEDLVDEAEQAIRTLIPKVDDEDIVPKNEESYEEAQPKPKMPKVETEEDDKEARLETSIE